MIVLNSCQSYLNGNIVPSVVLLKNFNRLLIGGSEIITDHDPADGAQPLIIRLR